MPLRVLVVDDEPVMQRVICYSLLRGGWQVITATNGREALEVATRELPNLIIMDVMMPEMDGLTALKHLREQPSTATTPVIMLTARGQLLTRQEAEQAGATAFFTKPFSPVQLAAEARRLMGVAEPPAPAPPAP